METAAGNVAFGWRSQRRSPSGKSFPSPCSAPGGPITWSSEKSLTRPDSAPSLGAIPSKEVVRGPSATQKKFQSLRAALQLRPSSAASASDKNRPSERQSIAKVVPFEEIYAIARDRAKAQVHEKRTPLRLRSSDKLFHRALALHLETVEATSPSTCEVLKRSLPRSLSSSPKRGNIPPKESIQPLDNSPLRMRRMNSDCASTNASISPKARSEIVVPGPQSFDEEAPKVDESPIVADSIATIPEAATRNSSKDSKVQAVVPQKDLVEVDPILEDMLESVDERADTLSNFEKQRIACAFARFAVQKELFKGDIGEFLRYLGHVKTNESDYMPLIRAMSSYDYLELGEILCFMENFRTYEREQFQEMFPKLKPDASGKISTKGLRTALRQLGFLPTCKMVEELLASVGDHKKPHIDFTGLLKLVVTYQYTEGFTKAEIADFQRNFNKVGDPSGPKGSTVLEPSQLCDVLVQTLGFGVASFAKEIAERLDKGQGLGLSSLKQEERYDAQRLTFRELLVVARCCREAQLRVCMPGRRTSSSTTLGEEDQSLFPEVDIDFETGISMKELFAVMPTKGYTPLKKVIAEIIGETAQGKWTKDREFMIDEYLDFMCVLYNNDGFTKAQLETLTNAFHHYERAGSSQINASELNSLIRYLGYRDAFDVHALIWKVEERELLKVDLRKFFRFMRFVREEQLTKYRVVFDRFRQQSKVIPFEILGEALEELGHDPARAAEEDSKKGLVDFDRFIVILDELCEAHSANQKKIAGFSDDEIEFFKYFFRESDQDDLGYIDPHSAQEVLADMGLDFKLWEDESGLLQRVEMARAAATDAGVLVEDEVEKINFWTFVQLARVVRSEEAKAEFERIQVLREQLRFLDEEVDQFRQLFNGYYLQEAREAKKDTRVMPVYPTISGFIVRRSITALAPAIPYEDKQLFIQKVASLDPEAKPGLENITFHNFLRLIRWVLDVNLGNMKAL